MLKPKVQYLGKNIKLIDLRMIFSPPNYMLILSENKMDFAVLTLGIRNLIFFTHLTVLSCIKKPLIKASVL